MTDTTAPRPARAPLTTLQPLRFTAFRLLAFVEGVTTVMLFFVAMPMKYLADAPGWVSFWGPVHGYAFLGYLALMVVALWGLRWPVNDWIRTAFVSFVPLGTFLNDPYLKRRYHEAMAPARVSAD